MNLNLQDAYQDVADRSLEAGDATLQRHLYETTCFLSYHAFESVGGALSTSYGLRYPAGHAQKINQFTALAKRGNHNPLAIASLAVQLSSLRNFCLYPEERGDGTVLRPQDQIPASIAKTLLNRVGGVVRSLKRVL